MSVGTRLRELREAHSLSQEALAERAGVHRNTVSDIERDQASATVRVLTKLADALDVQPHELLTHTPEAVAS